MYDLEKLPIMEGKVATAGCSRTGDFAHQFHVAFSSLVDNIVFSVVTLRFCSDKVREVRGYADTQALYQTASGVQMGQRSRPKIIRYVDRLC